MTNLTSDERRAVRTPLVTAGFTRTASSYDSGNGEYSELWRLGDNRVLLNWAARASAPVPVPVPVSEHPADCAGTCCYVEYDEDGFPDHV